MADVQLGPMADIRADVRCFQAPPDYGIGETTLRSYYASLPDPKRQTPPQSPLRGLTFVKQVPFLTGSSRWLRLTLLHDAPQSRSPAPADGNIIKLNADGDHRHLVNMILFTDKQAVLNNRNYVIVC